jgi:hypothetical protein
VDRRGKNANGNSLPGEVRILLKSHIEVSPKRESQYLPFAVFVPRLKINPRYIVVYNYMTNTIKTLSDEVSTVM